MLSENWKTSTGRNKNMPSIKQKKGRPGPNVLQNKQFRQALAAAGIENRKLMEMIGRCIEHCSRDLKMNLGFYEIKRIAEFMKASPERECNCDA
jgi:hypothetical protein